MSTRISKAFAKAKGEGRGAFVAYLTMGHPDRERSEAAFDALVAGGVDVVELGVPFSDPFADGGTIRAAAYKALAGGFSLKDALAMAGRLRARHPETPLVLFSYYNPVFSMGLEAFADAIREGRPTPIDVYDVAAWMATTALSEQSIALGSAPVAYPDFTNGRWMTRGRDAASGKYAL